MMISCQLTLSSSFTCALIVNAEYPNQIDESSALREQDDEGFLLIYEVASKLFIRN